MSTSLEIGAGKSPLILAAMLSSLACSFAHSASTEISQDIVNLASVQDWTGVKTSRPDPFIIRVQVLLDRTNISPGVIDGYLGDNLKKAMRIFEGRESLEAEGVISQKFWAALARDTGPVLQTYRITADDLSQRYVDQIPEDYAEMADMKWLGYTSPKEMLAERFHMDESLLGALNPQADFASIGSKIVVASIGDGSAEKVSRIVVDRSEGELVAYAGERMIAAYPATIGSGSNPSPSGTHHIKAVVENPSYTYDPRKNFQQGDNTEPLELPSGPNGPVGSVWIDLSDPTYGSWNVRTGSRR